MGALTIFSVGAYFVLFSPANYQGIKTIFVVDSGMNITEVVSALQKEKFIRSELGTKIALKLSRVNVINADTYDISQRMNAWQIARIVGGNEIGAVRTTIPEGYTIEQIGELLDKTGIIAQAEFVATAQNYLSDRDLLIHRPDGSLEGYLFPDTYNIAKGTSAENIVEKLLTNFKNRVESVVLTSNSQFNVHEIITLASLVEKEARTDEDRKLMAGVMLNRLNIGMKLDVDATVRYITNNWLAPITRDDLNSNSPYNTRKFAGLPPGPICNPGLAAIEAVLNPTQSSYFYYLTAPDGTSYYAKTLAEHNINKAKYL